jgi:uncharacterized protein (DUF3820 family)
MSGLTARSGLLAATVALAALAAPAQDDLRDVVRLHDGKELRGRVATPFAKDEVLLLQGGKRVRVPHKDVAAMDLVTDRVRELLERRARSPDNLTLAWLLVEWSRSRELHAMARLLAFDLVLRDDGHERAHELLGHRKTAKDWLWDLDGRWLPRDQFLAEWGRKRAELRSEHWLLRADGGFAQAVRALIDLESLYLWWFSAFGADLQLREAIQPMTIEVWRNGEAFPKWGFRPLPYYEPHPHGDRARTFFGTDPERPRLLFFTGSQALLYRCLANDPNLPNDRDRICPWLEVGLGMLAESSFQGPPGRAGAGPPRHQDLQALNALGRSFRLTHLVHLPMYGGFYLNDDTATAVNWSAAQTFASFLLDATRTPPTRGPFLDYVRQVFADRKGDSSSAFDKAMGRRIEDLEPELVAWLNKLAGF